MAEPIKGAFVPTTIPLDVAELKEVEVTSERFKELLVTLYESLNRISLSLNIKDSAYYSLDEFVSGNLFFPDNIDSSLKPNASYRPVIRKVINFGALPSNAMKAVAHGIDVTPSYIFTRIYGCAYDQANMRYYPMPNGNSWEISIRVTQTNVEISTDKGWSANAYVILEYIK